MKYNKISIFIFIGLFLKMSKKSNALQVNEEQIGSLLVEAVCEFRYTPKDNWDGTYPGLLYSEIRNNYPEKKTDKFIDWVVEFNPATTKSQQFQKEITRMKFVKKDKSGIVMVGENNLAISSLPLYMGWGKFKKEIINIFQLYDKIATSEDVLNRIGLRYINVVPTSAKENLNKYFKNEFPITLTEDNPVFMFQYQTQLEGSETFHNSLIKITLSNNPQINGKLLFDIDASLEPIGVEDESGEIEKFSILNLDENLELLHLNIKKVFVDVMSDLVFKEFNIKKWE